MIFRTRKGSERDYCVIAVTSCKGGIGKSTIAANLSYALSQIGRKVLCVDCDFSNRSLDLFFGCEDRAKFGVSDLVSGRAGPADTVVRLLSDRLFFIPGSSDGTSLFDTDSFSRALGAAVAHSSCDTVIIDTPGASEEILDVCCSVSDAGLIAVSHNPASVRGAEKTGRLLAGYGVGSRYLVINRFDARAVAEGRRLGINSLIDAVNIPLIGVIPDSPKLEAAQESGRTAASVEGDRTRAAAAFAELAARLTGKNIPLMSYLPERRRRILICS